MVKKLTKIANALKACKGKKGCEFAKCASKAFNKPIGQMPTNIKGLCK